MQFDVPGRLDRAAPGLAVDDHRHFLVVRRAYIGRVPDQQVLGIQRFPGCLHQVARFSVPDRAEGIRVDVSANFHCAAGIVIDIQDAAQVIQQGHAGGVAVIDGNIAALAAGITMAHVFSVDSSCQCGILDPRRIYFKIVSFSPDIRFVFSGAGCGVIPICVDIDLHLVKLTLDKIPALLTPPDETIGQPGVIRKVRRIIVCAGSSITDDKHIRIRRTVNSQDRVCSRAGMEVNAAELQVLAASVDNIDVTEAVRERAETVAINHGRREETVREFKLQPVSFVIPFDGHFVVQDLDVDFLVLDVAVGRIIDDCPAVCRNIDNQRFLQHVTSHGRSCTQVIRPGCAVISVHSE